MKYFLSENCFLKWLEASSVYNTYTDELYELDEPAFEFLKKCAAGGCEGAGCDMEFLDYAIQEGIITDKDTQVQRPVIRKSPEPSLRYLELQITRRCNLRCRHCYLGVQENTELSLKEIQSVLKEFAEMQGLRLLITGGEPLLHSAFDRINDLLPGYVFRKILFTNGVLLNKKVLKYLNADEIQISIDGLEKGHDALRGKGSFKKSVNAVRTAIDCGFDVSVSTMVHSGNLAEFEEMQRLFKEIGIKEWSVDIPCAEGNLKENPLFILSPEIAGPYLKYGFGEGLHAGAQGYACGLHLASVMADGRVARCAFYTDSTVGTISEGLEVCWKRIKPVRLESLLCDCSFAEICRGGCRYRALLLGNATGKDLYRCHAHGIASSRLSQMS